MAIAIGRVMSTYKSTCEETFRALVRDGRLVEFNPSRSSIRRQRVAAFTPEAHARLMSSWGSDDDELEILRRQLLVTVDRYVEGAIGSPAFSVLAPRPGIVQLRLITPSPGARIPGGFIGDEVFVGVLTFNRSELPHKARRQQSKDARMQYEDVNRTVERSFKEMGLWPLHKPNNLFRKKP